MAKFKVWNEHKLLWIILFTESKFILKYWKDREMYGDRRFKSSELITLILKLV